MVLIPSSSTTTPFQKPLKKNTAANNFFSGDFIPGRCDLLAN